VELQSSRRDGSVPRRHSSSSLASPFAAFWTGFHSASSVPVRGVWWRTLFVSFVIIALSGLPLWVGALRLDIGEL